MSGLLTLAVIGLGLTSAWRFLQGLGRRSSLIGVEDEVLRLAEGQYARGEISSQELEERRRMLFQR